MGWGYSYNSNTGDIDHSLAAEQAGKNFNRFADNVALPLLEGASYLSGLGELKAVWRARRFFLAAKTTTASAASDITLKLQSHVSRAAQEVDALGDAAFTSKQLQAIQRNASLRPMYRGNRIDVKARGYIKNDPALQHLKSNYRKGADFVDPATGKWWDMTTPGQWQNHVNKYGQGGTLLRTN